MWHHVTSDILPQRIPRWKAADLSVQLHDLSFLGKEFEKIMGWRISGFDIWQIWKSVISYLVMWKGKEIIVEEVITDMGNDDGGLVRESPQIPLAGLGIIVICQVICSCFLGPWTMILPSIQIGNL